MEITATHSTRSIKLEALHLFLPSTWVCPNTHRDSDDCSQWQAPFGNDLAMYNLAGRIFCKIFANCLILPQNAPFPVHQRAKDELRSNGFGQWLGARGKRLDLFSEAGKRSDVRASKLRHSAKSTYCKNSRRFGQLTCRQPIVNISVN